jgi:hypothetical protein
MLHRSSFKDMRDDHLRRRNARPAAVPRSRPAHAGPGPDPRPDSGPRPAKSRDDLMRGLIGATVACIAGAVVLLALKGSEIVTAAGIVLGGTAFVLVLSTAFYAIGRSEDRERAAREGGRDEPVA